MTRVTALMLLLAAAPAAATNLDEVVHLLKDSPRTLGDRLPSVAETIFRLDPANGSGAVFDAAMILALEEHPLREEAMRWLEAHAAGDPRDRYGYVLFERSARTLQQMLDLGGSEPAEQLLLGRRLLAEVARAMPRMSEPDLKAQLLVRAAVAHRICGKSEQASRLMLRARAMAGMDPEGGVEDAP